MTGGGPGSLDEGNLSSGRGWLQNGKRELDSGVFLC